MPVTASVQQCSGSLCQKEQKELFWLFLSFTLRNILFFFFFLMSHLRKVLLIFFKKRAKHKNLEDDLTEAQHTTSRFPHSSNR